MNKKDFYLNAAKDLDTMSEEGSFGENAKKMLKIRDTITAPEYLYTSIIEMFNYNKIGISNTVEITFTLLELYEDALKVSPNETISILTAFLKGTSKNPELENLSSYNEYIISKISTDESMKKITSNGKNNKLLDIKKSTMSVCSTYSKGVEFIGKTFTNLLALLQLINGKPYNLLYNSTLTTYLKIEEFEELSNSKYKILTNSIDRNIRNADSHLNITYLADKNCFCVKKNKKIYKVPFEEMMLNIYPKMTQFIEGFLASCYLFIMLEQDKEIYDKAIEYISIFKNEN